MDSAPADGSRSVRTPRPDPGRLCERHPAWSACQLDTDDLRGRRCNTMRTLPSGRILGFGRASPPNGLPRPSAMHPGPCPRSKRACGGVLKDASRAEFTATCSRTARQGVVDPTFMCGLICHATLNAQDPGSTPYLQVRPQWGVLITNRSSAPAGTPIMGPTGAPFAPEGPRLWRRRARDQKVAFVAICHLAKLLQRRCLGTPGLRSA
jgi:hypothetical protein